MAEEASGDVYTWLHSTRLIRWLLSRRGAWLVAILVGAASFLDINGTTGNLLGAQVAADYRLATQGRTTSGTVTGIDLPNHDSCTFTYRAEGRTFSRYEQGCGAGRSVGSAIRIVYVPGHPAVAASGDPVSWFWQDLLFSYGAPLSLGVFMFFGWRRFTKEQDAKYQPGAAVGRSA